MGDNKKKSSATTPTTERQEHISIIPITQEVVIDKCAADNCCDGKVHCPFCDTDHFKPTKSTRVRDHLELLHMSYAVQAEDLIIVKCFWNCGLTAGHYHCPYCPSKLLKRYAFTWHLYMHMQKLGKDKSCIVVPDPKNPTTIKGLGPEIHLCKKDVCYKEANSNKETNAKEANGNSENNNNAEDDFNQTDSLSTPNLEDSTAAASSKTTNENNTITDNGPHYHCPLCNLICKRRSPLINHLWRCMERLRSSQSTVDENWKKALNPDLKEANKILHPRDVKEIKYHISIVRTLNDLPIKKCYLPDCDCGHKFHCPLCVKDRFKPNYQGHLQLHYYAHWKRRVPYKDYFVLLCNSWCELKTGCHKVRYHFHCPICGATRRRRQGFSHHLKICNGPPAAQASTQKVNTSNNVDEESSLYLVSADGEEEEEEGEEEEILADLDEQFTTDLMMVRDEEAEEEEVGKGEGGDGKVAIPVAEEMVVSQTEFVDEKSLTQVDQCKESDDLENIQPLQDGKLPTQGEKETVELLPPTSMETPFQFTKEELYDEVSARLSFKCVNAFRDKGINVNEIFSDIAMRTGAEWHCVPDNYDTLSVHKFVGDFQALASTRDLLFKTLVGELPDDSLEKQTRQELTSSKLKTQVTDASVQVEDRSFLTSPLLQPSDNPQRKLTALNGKSKQLSLPVVTTNPALIRKKRGRPRKVPLPLEVADSANSEKGAKEGEVNIESLSVNSSLLPITMDLEANPEVLQTPRKRGRPRKLSLSEPVANEKASSDLMAAANRLNSAIADANQITEKAVLVETPVKRKRGRPRKDTSLEMPSPSVVVQDENLNVSLTPVSSPLTPDGTSSSKRYSTRGKKIDLSFLTGKNKRDDVDRLENEFICLKKNRVEASSILLQASPVRTKDEQYEKDNLHQSETEDEEKEKKEDSDFLVSSANGTSSSNTQVKKRKSRPVKSLIMSDVALLPTIRVDISKKRVHRKMQNLKNKKNTSAKDIAKSEKCLLASNGKTASDDGTTREKLSEGLQCHLCKLKSDRFDEMTDHLALVHAIEKPLRCDVCERTFEKLFDLRSHVNRKHGPFPQMDAVNCFKCGKTFQGTAKLNWHLSFIHKITREPTTTSKKSVWPCNQCNDDSKLCNLCGKVFSKGNHLVTHIQAVHTKEKAAQCTICNKKFNHIRYLRTHMKRHEGIKKHQCPTCGWRFFESNTLKDHMETHKEASKRRYRFTCDYCGQRYISKANFSDHLNKHTGEKPHKCQVCGKGFAFRTMLMKHQIHIHTTEKPFKCSYCERAFKFKAKLLQHTVIHTGVSKYVCESCNKPFSCAATLKHHHSRCRGNSSWQQNRTYANEGLTVMVDDLTLDQQTVQEQETANTVEIPVEDQSDIVIDMSGLSGMPEGSILQAAAQAAQLMEIPEVFMCSECNAVFSSLSDAEEHITSFHTDVVAVASTGMVEDSASEAKEDITAAGFELVDVTIAEESGST